jgi:hypothetical protein
MFEIKDYEQQTQDGVHKVRNIGGLVIVAQRHNLSILGGVYVNDEAELEAVLTHIAEMYEEHQKIAATEAGRKTR